jgi:hypothetical protein
VIISRGERPPHSIRIVNDTAGRRMNLDVFIVLK